MSQKGTIICYGDSNTYGYDPRSFMGGRYEENFRWTEILQKTSGYKVINCGLNGRCTPYYLPEVEAVCSQLHAWKEEPGPVWLWIMLGTNDLLHIPGMTAQGACQRMERFLQKLLACEEVASGAIRLRLIAPVCLQRGQWVETDALCEESRKVGGLYEELAKRLDIAFADAAKWGVELVFDGVHFSEKGNAQFAKGALKLLSENEKGMNKMNTQVVTKNGMLEGLDCGAYTLFKGVPYAKPPVGDLRFCPPQALPTWEGVRPAKEWGNIAVQDLPTDDVPYMALYYKEFYSDPEFVPDMSEDCLYVNIWAPKGGEKLPVAFWIHGGGFGGGYNSEIEFDGEAYCKKDVILVSVEYRLNVFGFLAHPWLSAESDMGISGNYGLLDQVAALNWVYENIAAFGGDPENITVFGQSAGCMSTQVLLSSPLTKGKIAKAILQSGVACAEEILATPTQAELETLGELLVGYTGAKSLEELRALSAEQLMEAKRQFDGEMFRTGKGLMLVPNVDGYLLEKNVKQVWKDGEMHPVPTMAGVVTNDLGSTPEEVAEGKAGILQKECERWSLKCEEVYGAPSYLYHFAHRLPGDESGAFHSAELWYTFGTYGRCWRPMTEADAALSEEMVADWTAFMKTGAPLAGWEPYTKDTRFIKKFQ